MEREKDVLDTVERLTGKRIPVPIKMQCIIEPGMSMKELNAMLCGLKRYLRPYVSPRSGRNQMSQVTTRIQENPCPKAEDSFDALKQKTPVRPKEEWELMADNCERVMDDIRGMLFQLIPKNSFHKA